MSQADDEREEQRREWVQFVHILSQQWSVLTNYIDLNTRNLIVNPNIQGEPSYEKKEWLWKIMNSGEVKFSQDEKRMFQSRGVELGLCLSSTNDVIIRNGRNIKLGKFQLERCRESYIMVAKAMGLSTMIEGKTLKRALEGYINQDVSKAEPLHQCIAYLSVNPKEVEIAKVAATFFGDGLDFFNHMIFSFERMKKRGRFDERDMKVSSDESSHIEISQNELWTIPFSPLPAVPESPHQVFTPVVELADDIISAPPPSSPLPPPSPIVPPRTPATPTLPTAAMAAGEELPATPTTEKKRKKLPFKGINPKSRLNGGLAVANRRALARQPPSPAQSRRGRKRPRNVGRGAYLQQQLLDQIAEEDEKKEIIPPSPVAPPPSSPPPTPLTPPPPTPTTPRPSSDSKIDRVTQVIEEKNSEMKDKLLTSIQAIVCSPDPAVTAIQQILGCPQPQQPPPTINSSLLNTIRNASFEMGRAEEKYDKSS